MTEPATDTLADYPPFPFADDDTFAGIRERSKRYRDLAGTDLEESKLLRYAQASADDLPVLLAVVDDYRQGLSQVPVDPPSLRSPRVAAVHKGVPVFFLQQTHHGVPMWMCGNVHISLDATKPTTCLGCGEETLTEVLYRWVLIDQDEPDKLLSE